MTADGIGRTSLTILVGGTPGTGKSCLIDRIRPKLLDSFNFINLSQFSIDNGCVKGHDDELDTEIVDEDKLMNKLEEVLEDKKFNVIECIHPDMISPVELVDKVYICRSDNTKLYDRLQARGYSKIKIENNVQAEIFQTILDESREYFGESKLTVLVSDNEQDLDNNAKIVVDEISKMLMRVDHHLE